jgi:tripartite-type tricarboxylate transporter receptor subunit TctC
MAAYVLRIVIVLSLIASASGENYPGRPVRIVTTQVGGIGDTVARLVGRQVSAAVGQPVIVDNRTSAVLPGQIVSQAQPDGYTLLVSGNIFWLSMLLQKLPYDPVNGFEPVTLMVRTPLLLVVHPSVPVSSVKDLIALAKSRPGALNYGSPGNGSPNHLAAELFKSMAGVDVVGVQYRGASLAITDLISDQVQVMFPSLGTVAAAIKSGQLKALAVTTAQPSALAPGLPTLASSGLPGFEAATVTGMFVPAKTPPAIVERMHGEVVRALASADIRQDLIRSGVEPVGSSPAEFASQIRSEMSRMGAVIKQAGIRID